MLAQYAGEEGIRIAFLLERLVQNRKHDRESVSGGALWRALGEPIRAKATTREDWENRCVIGARSEP